MDPGEMDSSDKSSAGLRFERCLPWALAGLLGVVFVPTWIRHIRRTIDFYTFNDDARILIWPFLRQTDPALFPSDPFVGYYQAGLPEGYLALYRTLGLLGWVRPASEVLQYLSVLAALAFIMLTARRLGGPIAAFIAAVLTLGSDSFFDRAGGGLPRGFAFPLVAAGLYALVSARPLQLAILAMVGAAFYPVVAALLGASLFVFLVLPSQLRAPAVASPLRAGDCTADTSRLAAVAWSWKRRFALLAATLFGIVLLLIPMTLRLKPYGEAIGPALLHAFPESGWGGRLSPEHHPPFESFATAAWRHARMALLGAGDPVVPVFGRWLRAAQWRSSIVLAAVGLWATACSILRAKQSPGLLRIWILPLVACCLHPLACLVAPRLFLPERYVQFAIPPFVVALVAVGFGSEAIGRNLRGFKNLRKPTLAVLMLAFVAGRGTSWVGIEVHVPERERAFYAAVAQLPKDVLIAGWPIGPLENIPYLAERRVLTNYQLEMPFHTRFTLESRARLRATFEAYFATTSAPIERLCTEFGVTHLVIDDTQFGPLAPEYYEPHRADIARAHAAGQDRFLLPQQFARHPSTRHFDTGLTLVTLAEMPSLARSCGKSQFTSHPAAADRAEHQP